MIPTKLRHEIYREALIQYNIAVNRSYMLTGLCNAIDKARRHLGVESSTNCPYDYPEGYPEFNAYNPNNDAGYWWDRDDTITRVKVLMDCIEKTKARLYE